MYAAEAAHFAETATKHPRGARRVAAAAAYLEGPATRSGALTARARYDLFGPPATHPTWKDPHVEAPPRPTQAFG